MTLDIQENVPLAPLTTFKIGGAARYFVEVRTEDDIHEALEWARVRNIRFVILAGGSNVLIRDDGVDGLVIRIAGNGFDFVENVLTADAGCNLLSTIRVGSDKGLGGWEKLAGIPGSIGGAARGNAGAFGTEIKDVAKSVRAIHALSGEVKEFSNAECGFGYRDSFFKRNSEWIILSVVVELKKMDPEESIRLIQETIAEREKRHLQNVCAAGSFFMNPVAPDAVRERFEKEKMMSSREGRVPAGWLIERAGMKGAAVGGAVASLQHPNYIVNTGNASAGDVLDLAQRIKEAVKKEFGVHLEEEAVIIR